MAWATWRAGEPSARACGWSILKTTSRASRSSGSSASESGSGRIREESSVWRRFARRRLISAAMATGFSKPSSALAGRQDDSIRPTTLRSRSSHGRAGRRLRHRRHWCGRGGGVGRRQADHQQALLGGTDGLGQSLGKPVNAIGVCGQFLGSDTVSHARSLQFKTDSR